MSLASIFLAHVPGDRRRIDEELAAIDAELAALVEAGRRAWPEIPLGADDFVAFLGRCLPNDADRASLRAAELYLVCAYALGIPGASKVFEARYVPRVEAALGRVGASAFMIADTLQDLRRRLLEMRDPQVVRRGYVGRGDLAAWLCVTAVREVGRRRERGKRETRFEESAADLLVAPDGDPELAYILRTNKQELSEAFQEALAELSHRDRNVLRYHFVEGLNIDQIGGVYGVHRATAARWIDRARDGLCRRTRELLARRVSLSVGGFQRMLGLIESQIRVRLGETSPEEEGEPGLSRCDRR